MQFDLSAVETGTMVVIGTLVFALILGLFMMAPSFAAMVLVGVGRLAWYLLARAADGLWSTASTTAGTGWSTTSELPGDFQVDFGTDFRLRSRADQPLAPALTRE